MQSNDVFDNVAAHDLRQLFDSQRFKLIPFELINCDYLTNDDKQSKHYYILPTHRKALIGFSFIYLRLTSAHPKAEGQANFDCIYLINGNRYGKHYYTIK